MKRTVLLSLVLTLLVIAHGPQAWGSPLTLTFKHTDGNPYYTDTFDVTKGLSGAHGGLPDFNVEQVGAWPDPSGHGVPLTTVNIGFDYTATLSGLSNNPSLTASVRLLGQYQLTYWSQPGDSNRFDGYITGKITAQDLTISPGLDPASVPLWLNGLTAVFGGSIGAPFGVGFGPDDVSPIFSLEPGPSTHVPEPSSFAVLLLSFGGLAAWRRSVRKPVAGAVGDARA